jgi:hypothetical protein
MSTISDTARRIRRACFAATAAVTLILAAGTGVAGANSYDVYACYAGQGTYLNPGDSATSWKLASNDTNYYLPYDYCGGSTDGFGVISRSGYTAPAGDEGEVYFQAPEGLHIRQVQLWRSLIDYGIGEGGASQRNYAWNLADGELPGVGDEFDGSDNVPYGAVGSGETTNNGIVPSNFLDVNLAGALPSQYAYVIGCAFYNGCPTGGQNPDVPSGFDTVLSIYGAIVSVEDNTPPTLTLSNTGLLDGAVQSGTVPLTLSASAIAGIAKLEVFADGGSSPAFTDTFTETSDCEFWEAVPCLNLQSYEYPIDTTQLPNGTYYLTVKAYDPAGNVVAASSPSAVTVRNEPITTQTASLTGGVSGVANGDPCAGAELGVEVNARPGVPVTPYGDPVTVRGVLHCGTVPIRGAQIAVSTVGGGASAAINTSVQTGVDGSFSYAVPTGPDRRLQFAYTAYSNDPGPSVTATATVAVRPSIKLAIGPRHTRNGHTIHWTGTIAGGPFPASGVTLDVEVQEGRRWRIFDQTVTGRTGRFHYSYHFHATTESTTYKFRVALPDTGSVGYPYTAGASNTVNVHVTP